MWIKLICRIFACYPFSVALFAVKGSEVTDNSALLMLVIAVMMWTSGDWLDS